MFPARKAACARENKILQPETLKYIFPMTSHDAKDRHTQFVDQIRRYDYAYYVEGRQIITDYEYDRLYRELFSFEKKFPELVTPDSPSQRVGGKPLEKFNQVRHKIPMMSLDNTYSEEDVRDFVQRMQKMLLNEHLEWVVKPKIDGLAVTLRYEGGVFIAGATRGKGVVGDDITLNLRTIKSLPLRLFDPRERIRHSDQGELLEFSPAEIPNTLEVRGEVFLKRGAFSKLNEERIEAGEEKFANPRNAAAGSLKLLDPKLVATRRLDVILYGVAFDQKDYVASGLPTKHHLLLRWLRLAGFKTTQHIENCKSLDELHHAIAELDAKRKSFDYITDGAVVKLNQILLRYRVGEHSKAPRWAVAYKYAPEQAETKLNGITIQVGRTGSAHTRG